MIKHRALAAVLEQATTGGIKCALLINPHGALLASSGCSGPEKKDACIKAALASNIWSSTEKCGKTTFNEDDLEMILIECEGGKIAVTRVINLLLCLQSENGVGFGMLKAKLKALASYLEPSLRNVTT